MKLNFLNHPPDLRFDSLFPELQSPPKKKFLKLHEPISALVLGILGANIGWIVGGTTIWLSQVVAYAAVAIVVSYSLYSTFAAGKKGKHGRTGLQSIDESGQLINSRETSIPVKLAYGKIKVGGNWVFADQSVYDSNLLNVVVSWGEGECDSISESIDWMPQFTGTGYNDLHTGGEISTSTVCTCDQTCYEYSSCTTCNMTFYGLVWPPTFEFPCICDYLCYGYTQCSCDLACYGYGDSQFIVEIDCAAETPNEFKWSKDGGLSFDATNVPITTSWQNLAFGAKIKFDSAVGHVLADSWAFWVGEGIFVGERMKQYFEDYGGLDLFEHEFHTGSATQTASATIKAEWPGWEEAMKNTCYSWFRLTYNINAFKNIPDFSIILKAKKVYDPRNGAIIWSRNPALVWLDFMISARYGLGVSTNLIDMDSVEDAANWCDANSYYFDGTINDRQAFLDNMEDLLNNFRAYVVWSEGVYKLKIHDDDAAVMSLDEDDVEISESSFSISIPGIPESINKVKTVFADAEINYTTNFATWEDPEQLAYDGESKVFEIPLIGTSSFSQAQKLAKFYCMRNKYSKEFSILAHPRTYALEPGDMILVTHEFPNWTNKKLRVKSISLAEDGLVGLLLMDEDEEIYDETLVSGFVSADGYQAIQAISSTSPILLNYLTGRMSTHVVTSTAPFVLNPFVLEMSNATQSVSSEIPTFTPHFINAHNASQNTSSTSSAFTHSGIFMPAQSSDDAHQWQAEVPYFATNDLYCRMGDNGEYPVCISGVRFVNVTIPQGKTIISAILTLQAYISKATVTCRLRINGYDADDATTFSNQADWNTKRLYPTSANVTWEPAAWVQDTDYDSPEIKTVIQEILNRVGWVSGNDLILWIGDQGSDGNAYRDAKSFEQSASNCVRLHITWNQ